MTTNIWDTRQTDITQLSNTQLVKLILEGKPGSDLSRSALRELIARNKQHRNELEIMGVKAGSQSAQERWQVFVAGMAEKVEVIKYKLPATKNLFFMLTISMIGIITLTGLLGIFFINSGYQPFNSIIAAIVTAIAGIVFAYIDIEKMSRWKIMLIGTLGAIFGVLIWFLYSYFAVILASS